MKAAIVRGPGRTPVYADFADPAPTSGESHVTVTAAALPEWFAASRDRTRGEFALVLHPKPATSDDGAEGERVLRLLLEELPLKSAVRIAAEISGAPRNTLYDAALRMREEPND